MQRTALRDAVLMLGVRPTQTDEIQRRIKEENTLGTWNLPPRIRHHRTDDPSAVTHHGDGDEAIGDRETAGGEPARPVNFELEL